MKALTIRQPWADAFFQTPADRAKDVENRGWATRHRGLLAIHAGLAVDYGGLEYLNLDVRSIRDRGVIIGTVELTGCHEAGIGCMPHGCATNPWAFWPVPDTFGRRARIVHWMVEHPRKFVTPIRARGAQTLWEPDASVAYLIKTAEVVS